MSEQAPGRWRLMRFMRHLRIGSAWITWGIRAMRLIRCILDPLINRRAPINHANPRLSEYPRSGPPLQQQVLAIAGASWPVEPGSAS